MAQSKGKYIFLEADAEEQNQSDQDSNIVHWRLPEYLPNLKSIDKLKSFHNQVVKFNEKINLVSKKSINNSDILNFFDSIVSVQAILKDTDSDQIFDIGSGNGFPGLVMAILDSNRKVVLLDRDRRKIEFLKYVAGKLLLKNVSVRCIDFSELEPNSISCAVTRGFASVSKSLLLCKKALLSGAPFYHMKGPLWSNEVGEMPPQLISYWMTSLLHEYKLPEELGERFVVKTLYR